MDIKFIKGADGPCFVDVTATVGTEPTGRFNLPQGSGYNCDVAANKHTIIAPNLPGGRLRFLTSEINKGGSDPVLVGSGTAALYTEINNGFFRKASSAGVSGGGSADTLEPLTNLTATVGDGEIIADWDDAPSPADGYTIQASPNSDFSAPKISATSPTAPKTITGLTNGVGYHLRGRSTKSGYNPSVWVTLAGNTTVTPSNLPHINPNTDIVRASSYETLPTTPDSGTAAEVYVLNSSPLDRIRQKGTIHKVEFYVGNIPAGLTNFYVDVWRYNGSSGDRIARRDVAGQLVANSLNLITLVSPITGILEGDYMGFGFIAPGNSSTWLCTHPTIVYSDLYSLTDPGINTVWGTHPSLGSNIPIRCYMGAPVFVTLSNSILEGYPLHFSYVNEWASPTEDFTNVTGRILADSLGVSYQNFGKGGQQTYQMLANFAEIIALKPRIVIIEGATNDLNGADRLGTYSGVPRTETVPIANLDDMFQLAQDNGIIPVYVSIPPRSDSTNTKAAQADLVNAHVIANIGSYGGLFVDIRQELGVDRAGQAVGNKWDANPAYFNADTVHLNPAGAAIVAAKIETELTAVYSF